MEYFTADSYSRAERVGAPFQINGKLYSRVKIIEIFKQDLRNYGLDLSNKDLEIIFRGNYGYKKHCTTWR